MGVHGIPQLEWVSAARAFKDPVDEWAREGNVEFADDGFNIIGTFDVDDEETEDALIKALGRPIHREERDNGGSRLTFALPVTNAYDAALYVKGRTAPAYLYGPMQLWYRVMTVSETDDYVISIEITNPMQMTVWIMPEMKTAAVDIDQAVATLSTSGKYDTVTRTYRQAGQGHGDVVITFPGEPNDSPFPLAAYDEIAAAFSSPQPS